VRGAELPLSPQRDGDICQSAPDRGERGFPRSGMRIQSPLLPIKHVASAKWGNMRQAKAR